MSVKLTVKHRSEGSSNEHVLDDPAITLGREKSCQIVLAEQAVSRKHARISRDGALFFIEDLGSAYGTTINGNKLPKGEKRLLRNGDVIAIAQFDVTFDRVAEVVATGEKTSFVAKQMVKDVIKGVGAGANPFLRIMNGPNEGKRIEISDAQEIVMGRDPTMADYVLKDDLVSRRHAKIRRDWAGTHVEDLSSRNGIKVNKKRVTRKTLRDKDELQVGATQFLYLDSSEVREEAPQLEDFVPDDEGGNTIPPSPPEPEAAPGASSESAPGASSESAPGSSSESAPGSSSESAPGASSESAPGSSSESAPGSSSESAPGSSSESNPSESISQSVESDSRPTRAAELDQDPAAARAAEIRRYAIIAVMGLTGLLAFVMILLVLVGA